MNGKKKEKDEKPMTKENKERIKGKKEKNEK